MMDVRALVKHAQNEVWNGQTAADAALDSVVEQITAEVRRLHGLGATGQLEVTEEWTQLPGTDVEIRLRPPMRSGYVGYRQRWPRTDGEA